MISYDLSIKMGKSQNFQTRRSSLQEMCAKFAHRGEELKSIELALPIKKHFKIEKYLPNSI